MKTIKLFTLLVALLCTTTSTWATDYNVGTDAELRAAIQNDGANITVTADIDLSNSTLSIATNTTVTIDLGGHTLDRKLTQRGDGGGQVITVRSGATLNLSNGILKGGWGGDSGGINNEGGIVNLTNVTITGCTGDNRGGAINNKVDGIITMTGGSIIGNTSKDIKVQDSDRVGGGGIFNAEGATVTLTNVTISGNEAKAYGGGGICNYGKLTLDGCTIQNNTARHVGGGIWHGNNETWGLELKMKGANIITDNIAGNLTSNLFMTDRRKITCIGSITGSRIGVALNAIPNMFTDGFATYHSGNDFSTIFQCDRPETDSLSTVQPLPYYLDIGEVLLSNRVRAGTYPYVERSWDSENKKVVSTTKFVTEEIDFNATPTSETLYKRLYSTDDRYVELGTENSELHEYYVVDDPDDEVEFTNLIVNGPNVHIIICDGSRLHFINYIDVHENHTLFIHAQSAGSKMCRLFNDQDCDNYGGIGSNGENLGGNIEIHGGNLNIYGGSQSAAIGGDFKEGSGYITIYDGRITVVGGGSSAGIGAGAVAKDYGNITIYDGWIDATGGPADNPLMECGGAGIGGGSASLNGKLTIWGGTITARGDHESAGIGSAQYGGDHGAGTIVINGGDIKAYGNTYGAGIGGGDGKNGGTLIINGGRVEAYGGTDAAGIGGGEGGSGGYVTINGGYVYAEGGWEYGAGIGGGEDGAGANVTINGGIVVAKSGNVGVGGMRGIGPGGGSNDYGTLTIADNMMVRTWNGNEGPFPRGERRDYCWNHTQARIEPCTHPNASYGYDGHRINPNCEYCYTYSMPFTFYADGNWDDETKWLGSLMPHDGEDVAVKANATIPAGYCANIGIITIDDGSLTIADGGQLIHYNSGVTATVQKNITGHGGDDNNGWNFIAAPMVAEVIPAKANGFLTDDYDLYYYEEPTHYWRNFKGSEHGHFGIEPQKGYLYANHDNTTLNMTGPLQPSNNPVIINGLSHDASVLNGFNLVGNPFACNATIDRPFYVIDGNHVVAYEGSAPIAPGTGVMVQADADHESVTFTKVTPEAQASQPKSGSLQIALTQANTRSNAKIDNAIVSFNQGNQLEKFHFGNDAKVYIPQGGKDYAIAFSEGQGEIPINFKATENGTYTITVNPEGVNLAYLHLIDNMTGANVDLLATKG